jgi:hypothetical protein
MKYGGNLDCPATLKLIAKIQRDAVRQTQPLALGDANYKVYDSINALFPNQLDPMWPVMVSATEAGPRYKSAEEVHPDYYEKMRQQWSAIDNSIGKRIAATYAATCITEIDDSRKAWKAWQDIRNQLSH